MERNFDLMSNGLRLMLALRGKSFFVLDPMMARIYLHGCEAS
jgi:hypothetical protein